MGSTQSNPNADNSVDNHVDPSSTAENNNHLSHSSCDPKVDSDIDTTTKTDVKRYDPNRPKSGMPLVNYVCRKKKMAYDKCVSGWYSTDFLSGNGQSLNQEDVCGPKFEVYRRCILKGIKKELWDKQDLPPPLEGSPLSEIIDDKDEE
jgi:hypothetical protein